jgi:outer membrane protein assembly factor BamB
VEWSEEQNVRWKTAIPGRGHASPVIWGDLVFLTTAVETGADAEPEAVKAAAAETPSFHRDSAHMPGKVLGFVVLALRRGDGGVLWRRTVREQAPHAATHADGSWASGSPVTDGERVYAWFGSYGLYALDMDGNVVWEKQWGPFKVKANFGEGSSPVLCGDLLIVNQDQEGPSFITALDRRTGEEKWRVARDEATSWATPLVVEHDGRRQVVTSATKRIRSYAAEDGALLWEATGMTGNVVPCPVAAKGVVYCMSGFRGSALMAISLDAAAGDITGTPDALAWSRAEDTPYVPSPLLYDGLLYYLKGNKGALTCVDAATGEVRYGPQELEGIRMVYASPVGAAGRVYLTGRDGLTYVVRQGPVFDVLARNTLDDQFSASAALAGGDLFLRGHAHLYCLGREAGE